MLKGPSSGATLGQQSWTGDGPTVGRRCPRQLLLGLVLVHVYLKNLLVMHVCRLHLELHIVVGICPMHSSWIFLFYIYAQSCLICLGSTIIILQHTPLVGLAEVVDITASPSFPSPLLPEVTAPVATTVQDRSHHPSPQAAQIYPQWPFKTRCQASIEVWQLTFPRATLAASTCALCLQSRKERWPGCPSQVDCSPNDLSGASWTVALKPI